MPCAAATVTSQAGLRALRKRGKLQCQHHLGSSPSEPPPPKPPREGSMEGPVLPMLTLVIESGARYALQNGDQH